MDTSNSAILYIYFTGNFTGPFAAYSVNNKEYEEEANVYFQVMFSMPSLLFTLPINLFVLPYREWIQTPTIKGNNVFAKLLHT